jgi:hypothetical protein
MNGERFTNVVRFEAAIQAALNGLKLPAMLLELGIQMGLAASPPSSRLNHLF